MNRLRAL